MAYSVMERNGYCLVEDTYIEQHFHDECQKDSLGEKLWSDWVYNKHQYIGHTKTTIYEFMNYSMHDESHSINILKSVERILGKERVDRLSLGDLWLLLNVAYAHDIGMSTRYDELLEMWKDKDFLDYVDKERRSFEKDAKNAAEHYFYLDAFIRRQTGDYETNPEEDISFFME